MFKHGEFVEFCVCLMGVSVWWSGTIVEAYGDYYDIRLDQSSVLYCAKFTHIRRPKRAV